MLDDGVIAERGTHDALLAEDGLYASMWNRQRVAGGGRTLREAESGGGSRAEGADGEAIAAGSSPRARPSRRPALEPVGLRRLPLHSAAVFRALSGGTYAAETA